MRGYLERNEEIRIKTYLSEFPAVAILGPRQSGKTTLAKKIVSESGNAEYLDLEKQSDLRKLQDPELFFQANRDRLICLDEIQRTPPRLTKGFWNSLDDLKIEKSFVIAMVDSAYPIKKNVMVTPLDRFLNSNQS